ncbi:MAG: UDP-N-acetylmuramoyl-L-alanyl-D-glutamate--2,6-diaminopimelate ligase [Chloroflexota bacterium]
MRLRALLRAAGLSEAGIEGDGPEVGGIADDSRAVRPGDLFVAEPGRHVDGLRFVPQAVARGAVAVLAQESLPAEVAAQGVATVLVPDVRPAWADLAAAFHGFPARLLHVTGVTGTDGKSTTCVLLAAVLEAAGFHSGVVGTVLLKIGGDVQPNRTRMTTPKAHDGQALLARMVAAGVTHAVLETSSHALALDRVRNCAFDAAVLTNVTSEHLDFHRTREEYLAAKGRLFALLDAGEPKDLTACGSAARFAVLNRDDSSYDVYRPGVRSRVISYGIEHADAEVRGHAVHATAAGTSFRVTAGDDMVEVRTRLPGLFNVYNCLAALAYARGLGIDLAVTASALGRVEGVPGRMQRVVAGQPFEVVVDYAHTPDSLQKVLAVLRPLTTGRLIVVFGSAGERDRGKRPLMGAVAARHADFFVVADEDPRLEDPQPILQEMAAGARGAGAREGHEFLCIADRREAIRAALRAARPGDVVLLAGKGHESTIEAGGVTLPWDEAAVTRRLLLEESLVEP